MAASAQSQKNIERMRLEVNKRIEQHMLEIIKILDDMDVGIGIDGVQRQSKETLYTVEEDEAMKIISTETILRASAIASEDVDE